MEILEGNFERVIDIPLPIQAERVAAKQDNGWLWITLPVLQREVKP
jgi:HSP20 family molecular chaperone IbpA